MEQFTKPVEGQSYCQETTPTHGSHKFRVALNVSKAIHWLSNALEIQASFLRAYTSETLWQEANPI